MQILERESFKKMDFARETQKNSQLEAASCFWVAFNGFREVVQILHRLRINYLSWKRLSIVN